MARERGILTLVDGAQVFGVLHIDLHDIGCDFYTGSSHKWLVGPKEAGLLYDNEEEMQRAVIALARNRSGAGALGVRLREDFMRRFDPENEIDQLLAAYAAA